jgi:hypothetical protein
MAKRKAIQRRAATVEHHNPADDTKRNRDATRRMIRESEEKTLAREKDRDKRIDDLEARLKAVEGAIELAPTDVPAAGQ